jgi:hypothetical protein
MFQKLLPKKRESNKTATKPEKILFFLFFFSVKKFQDGANASF